MPVEERDVEDQRQREAERPNPWLILSVVAVGTFMAPLDGTVVNIALPVIAREFGTPITTVEWVSMAYLLVISTLLLLYGRLGDLFGHKPVYQAGFAVFTVGSLLSGLSPSIGFLIGARVVQALGAGMMMAIGPAIITHAFPPHQRGRALGIIGSVVATGAAVGPTFGGLLISYFGWPAIFFINLPIGLFGIFWAARVLTWERPRQRVPFDLAGAFLIFAGLMSFLLALSQGSHWGWRSTPTVTLLGLAALLLAVFVVVERRLPHPMMRLGLFRNRIFASANAAALLNFVGQFSATFLMPFYLQDLLGKSPLQAGLLMTAFPLTVMLVAPISGALSDRMGSRILSTTGMLLMASGLFLLSTLRPDSSPLAISGRLMVGGLGAGLFQAPNNSSIMGSVPRQFSGIAAGMLATMRNVGMVTGIALSGALFTSHLQQLTVELSGAGLSGAALEEAAFIGAFRVALQAGAAIQVVGALISLTRGQESETGRQPSPT